MISKDEALKMAIEVFDMYGNKLNSAFADEAYQACKEALEQPTTQELYDNGGNMTITTQSLTHVIGLDSKGYEAVVKLQSPLYTHPKEWQGLSDEEIWDIANFLGKNKEWDYPVMFAKTIEKALKEKNNASS